MGVTFYKKWIQTLLPKSRAFNLGSSKTITKFFESIAFIVDLIRDHLGEMLLEVYPGLATEISPWVKRLNLPNASTLTVIEAEWGDTGSISPHHLQERIQAAGYDAYVHEFWDPSLDPSDPAWLRDPTSHIEIKQSLSGGSFISGDNLLANDHRTARPNYPYTCGNKNHTCGDKTKTFGYWDATIFENKGYIVNDDVAEFPSYFYVCGATWPDSFYTDQDLTELRRLIFKIKPTRLRCVLIAEGIGDKLERIDGSGYEDPQVGVEYYSPEQHNDRYGTVIRQYFIMSNVATNTEILADIKSVQMLSGSLYESGTDVSTIMTGNGGTGSAYAVPTGLNVELKQPVLFNPIGTGSLEVQPATDYQQATDIFLFWIDYCREGV